MPTLDYIFESLGWYGPLLTGLGWVVFAAVIVYAIFEVASTDGDIMTSETSDQEDALPMWRVYADGTVQELESEDTEPYCWMSDDYIVVNAADEAAALARAFR